MFPARRESEPKESKRIHRVHGPKPPIANMRDEARRASRRAPAPARSPPSIVMLLVFYISGHGFGHAVRCGLDAFTGDAVAIMMADGSDSPDDLVRYYYVLRDHAAHRRTGLGHLDDAVRTVLLAVAAPYAGFIDVNLAGRGHVYVET